jgi:molecular chaperone DnaK (HSP70)
MEVVRDPEEPGGPDVKEVVNLIFVDDVVPKSVTRNFWTFKDDQQGVTLRCMENLHRDAKPTPPERSVEIGSAEISFTRPLPKRSPLEVTFSLTEDGLLSVHGLDQTTNQEIDASFNTAAILTNEELEESKAVTTAIAVS